MLWLAIASVMGTTACSGGDDSAPAGNDALGTVQVALTSTGAGNVSYKLSNAVFEVTNPFVSPPVDITVSGDDPMLNISLAPSVFSFDYQITLQDGWTLSAVNPDGTETPLAATVVTSFIPFTIKPQRTTPITFQFKASEQVITMGDGTASVKINVDDTLIDDFEDGDGFIAPLGGRNGAWFTFNDGTGTQTPPPFSPVLPEVVDTSANFVLHMTATGFAPAGPLPDGSFAFGAGVGTNMVTDLNTFLPIPYDASKYGGINFTFTTRTGFSAPVQVSFLVATTDTAPIAQGGTCDPSTQVCNDDFGFVGFVPPGDFTFSGGFLWSQLRQQGFGTPATFDPSKILTIKWIVQFPNFGQTSGADNVDFTLDDVTFTPGGVPSTPVRRAAPSASTGPSPSWGP
jgi:hypothetical protein